VAAYDVFCATCGIKETVRPISERGPFVCPDCGGPAEQRFSPEHVHHARIDDMENVGAERRDPRTHRVNLGLGGRFVEIGRRQDGSKVMDYRPITSAEASSVRKAKEIAREQNLTPADSGRYRSTR
jgi:hypothetical protein